jgi:hypothetical protein
MRLQTTEAALARLPGETLVAHGAHETAELGGVYD